MHDTLKDAPISGENEEGGASLVEYALLVTLIAVVCLAAVQFLGHRISQRFSYFGTQT